MSPEELELARREFQQWEIDQIQSALRDADSGKFVQHDTLADILGIEANPPNHGRQINILWADIFIRYLRKFLEYNQQCSGAVSFERHFDRVVSTVEFLSERPQVGYPGRVLGTREWSFSLVSPIVVYRVIPGELHVLYELHDSKKGRPRPMPARA